MLNRVKNKLQAMRQNWLINSNRCQFLKPYNAQYYSGKTIAIVGAADSALVEENGAYIDSFDIVVRINRGIDNFQDKANYLGSRTDVLFHGLHEDPVSGCGPVLPIEWKKKAVQKVIFPLQGAAFKPLVDTFLLRNKAGLIIEQLSLEQVQELDQVLHGFRSTTGFAALYFLSKTDFKKLYITGFTFFKTAHQKGYNDQLSWPQVKEVIQSHNLHNPEMEYQFFKQFYQSAKAVELDQGMQKLIGDYEG